MKKTTIPLLILLMVTLFGGLMLVKQNQDTRKGASFAKTVLKLIHDTTIVNKVGEVVPVKLWYYTENQAKVDGVQTVVCWGNNVKLNESGVVVNTQNGFESVPIVVIKDNCATLVATSKQTADKLKTTGEVFALNFEAISEGEGTITIKKESSVVTGDNPASPTDKEIAVTAVENTTYKIAGTSNICDRCSTDFNNMRVTYTSTDCSIVPAEDKITRTYDASCQDGENYCQRCSRINDNQYTWWKPLENKTCDDDPLDNETQPVYRAYNEKCSLYCDNDSDCPSGFECIQPPMPTCGDKNINCLDVMPRKICVPITSPTPTIDVCNATINRPIDCVCTLDAQCASKYCNPTSEKCTIKPTATPTPGDGISEWPVLNYKVQYGYVKPDYSKCFVPNDWPLQITVLSGGITKTYSNVVPSKINRSGDFVTAEGSLILEGFDKTNNVAVFMKGPKHLQMKYAVDKQEGRYNKAGGELILTKFVDTSQVYDFTAYPILPGDIAGKNTDNPDGVVNGYDWTEIKKWAKVYKTTDDGGYFKADLDGSCQVNSNDLYILRLTLEEKQGELY